MNWYFIYCVSLYGIVVQSASVSFQDQILEIVRNENDTVPSETITPRQMDLLNITIKLNIIFDRQLIEKLAGEFNKSTKEREFLSKITEVLVKDVEEIYKDPTLDVNVHFSHETNFLKWNSKFSGNEVEASVYLRGFCMWQASQKKLKDQRYFSVLLTGINLIEDPDVNAAAYTTLAYQSSICTWNQSCTLQQWIPEELPYNLAAAIGYSLGMTYDVPSVAGCEENQSIMDMDFKPEEDKAYWTECNGYDLRLYLTSDKAECIFSKEHNKKVDFAD